MFRLKADPPRESEFPLDVVVDRRNCLSGMVARWCRGRESVTLATDAMVNFPGQLDRGTAWSYYPVAVAEESKG